MSISVEASATDRLISDARQAFSKFRTVFLSDAFVADPDEDLAWLRDQSTSFRIRATELGLNVFAEIVRCLESSLDGLIKNHCELSDSLIILIKVAEDALHGHETNDLNAPALVARASVEYRRIRNLPKNGDTRATRKILKRLETLPEVAAEEFTVSRDDLVAMLEGLPAELAPINAVPAESEGQVTQIDELAMTDRSSEVATPLQTEVVSESPASRNAMSARPVATAPREVESPAVDTETDDDKILKAIFIEEVSDHCRHLQEILSRINGVAGCANELEDIRRRTHSIKGSAGVMGWHVVARLSHRTEDLLEHLTSGRFSQESDGLDLLQCCIDTIGELLTDAPCDDLLELVYQRFDELGLPDPTRSVAHDGGTPALPAHSEVRDETTSDENSGTSDLAQIELDNLDEISPEMREIFTEEAEDHLRNIYAAFARAETEGPTASLVREIRRSVHTLKGAAGAVGFRVVSKWGHRMEDILDRLEEGQEIASAGTIALLYRTTDAIQDLVHGKYDPQDLRQRLARLLADYESHATEFGIGDAVGSSAQNHLKSSEQSKSSKKEIRVDVDLIDFEAVANSAREARSRAATPQVTRKSGSQQVLRVPIERLDALARTVSELAINRTAFEQKMADLMRFVEDNQASVQRLRRISYTLETEFGVKLLGGNRAFAHATGTPSLFQNKKHSGQAEEFDSLEFDRYSDFHVLARSLAETTSDFDTVGNELRGLLGDFDTLLNRQGRLAREAQGRIMGIRMVPLATLTSRLHRAVRVVAQEQNKDVVLKIHGEGVELDKLVLEEIADPLLHLLRNAVDHGIEPPESRHSSGKPAQASIQIQAYHQGTQVVLQVQDDGRGLDYEKIRTKAVQTGVLSSTEADCSTEEDLQQLIYVPGFSTATQVSEISGRGVGMDVVRDKVLKLKGTIEISSEPGCGTTFTIRLPVTMAITRALLISANQETFALPIQVVQQILRIEKRELSQLDQDSVIRIKDHVYPVVRLADRLNLRQRGDTAGDMLPTLLVSAGGRTAAIVVDRIISSRDIVVKTLGNHLQYLPGLIGATLMGDGTVVPILDALDLVGVRSGRIYSPPVNEPTTAEPAEPVEIAEANRTIKVMIVDDSVSVRRVMSNLIKNAGLVPIVAKDGVDALELLQSDENVPDIFLLDIEMPRMDGFELLATLRGQAQHAETPVVMITSRAGEKHQAKAFQLGASEYLTKPFRDQELLDMIRTLTQQEAMALSSV